MLLRSLRFLAPLLFVGAAALTSIAIVACSTGGTGDCVCRLDSKHPESGIVTCEGTVGGGRPEQCKLEDESAKNPQTFVSVICDPDDDPDEANCAVIQ